MEKPKLEQFKTGPKNKQEASHYRYYEQTWPIAVSFRITEEKYNELIDLCNSTGDIISVVARRGLYKEMARLKKEYEDERKED